MTRVCLKQSLGMSLENRKGNDNENLRFIISGNKDLTKSRLSLLFAISNVLKSGLDIIGVNAPKEMN